MSIIGFNFTKINVEKKDTKRTANVKIANNVSLKSVTKANLSVDNAVKFEFMYETKFDPDMGTIQLEGNLISIEKEAEKIVEGYEKSKKVDQDVMKKILNTILAKTSVQALILSKEVNLPSPIQLPKVNVKG